MRTNLGVSRNVKRKSGVLPVFLKKANIRNNSVNPDAVIKLDSGKHNTINLLLTGELPVLGEYSVEVAVQTVNLLSSGSGGSTPSSPIRRVEKWNLARLITLRSAVQIRLLQFVECTLVAN